MPGSPLEARVSRQWTEIGFQGNDPATDFRGMGILSLECMLYPLQCLCLPSIARSLYF